MRRPTRVLSGRARASRLGRLATLAVGTGVAALVAPAVLASAETAPGGAAAVEVGATLTAGSSAGAGALAPAEADAAATATGAVYRPVSPVRVLDTRFGVGGSPFAANSPQQVAVATQAVLAAAGVNAGQVTGVVLNVTSVGSSGESWVSVWGAGRPWPGSSSLNVASAGQTIPNLTTSPVVDGSVSIMAVTDMHLVADVQGVYVTGAGTTAGRFQPLAPSRVYDTRTTGNPLAAGEERIVDVGAAGVPPHATAVVLNVTSVISPDQQFLVVWPADRPRPLASNLNVEYRTQTVANQVISGLDQGRVKIYGTAGGHVLVDVAGYYTGAAAGQGSDGLFHAVTPTRLLDTRGRGVPLYPGERVDVAAAGRAEIPSAGVSGLALNVTATQASAGGYVTVYPAQNPRPNASVLNPERDGQTVANHAVTSVSTGGFSLYTATGTHLLADVAGYFTGDPAASLAPGSIPADVPTGPHTFLYTGGGGIARWNPCQKLTYVVNDDRATSAQRDLLDSVILEAEHASGIDFVYVGETSGGLDGQPPQGARAVIGFSDGSATPQLSGGTVGIGGGSFYAGTPTRDGSVASGYALFVNSFGTSVQQRELMLHEIGHMLGLGHINDATQVMNPYVVSLDHYANGDRAGLHRLGSAQGCVAVGSLSVEPGADTPGNPPQHVWMADHVDELTAGHADGHGHD